MRHDDDDDYQTMASMMVKVENDDDNSFEIERGIMMTITRPWRPCTFAPLPAEHLPPLCK